MIDSYSLATDFDYRIGHLKRLADRVIAQGGSPLPEARRQAIWNALTKGPVYLLGSTSQFASAFIRFAHDHFPVAAVVDDQSTQRFIQGIRRIDSHEYLGEAAHSLSVCLAFSHPAFTYFKGLADIAGAAFVDYMEATESIPQYPSDPLLHGLASETASQLNRLLALCSTFEDWGSKNTLLSILMARLSYDRSWLEAVNSGPNTMYFSIVPFQAGEALIDCGAYDGDTISVFKDAVNDCFDKIVALEPDPRNFDILRSRFGCDPRIELQQCGSWSSSGELAFEGGSGSFSYISEGSLQNQTPARIEVRALDDIIQDRVSAIKIDVEGADVETLKGARTLIGAHKPKLMVAAYHRPLHVADIAGEILQTNPAYRLYLRHHGGFFLETVLYAISREQSPEYRPSL